MTAPPNGCELLEQKCWRERECRFDVKESDLTQQNGEELIDYLPQVEDTKGNNGQSGRLLITNMRLIWMSDKKSKTNLSIGLNAIFQLSIKSVNSRLRGGQTRSLFVSAKSNVHKFQFIFTNAITDTPRLFTTIQAVHRAYDTSRLYREIRLRNAVVNEGQLNLLPNETIIEEVRGVWNLAQAQGQLGHMFITNIRMVWYARSNEIFNISLPYYKVLNLSHKDTKYGKTMVVKCTKTGGGYTLGFRIDPPERVVEVTTQVTGMLGIFKATPILGVDFQREAAPPPLEDLKVEAQEEDVQIIDQGVSDAFADYIVEAISGNVNQRPPVFNADLGLAVEELRDGLTIKSLWSVP
eukprot:m.61518 g.61518  ORF g.61518 m.61518 type:complete len:352 (+) comp11421_c0_seq1:191-1246(+)